MQNCMNVCQFFNKKKKNKVRKFKEIIYIQISYIQNIK